MDKRNWYSTEWAPRSNLDQTKAYETGKRTWLENQATNARSLGWRIIRPSYPFTSRRIVFLSKSLKTVSLAHVSAHIHLCHAAIFKSAYLNKMVFLFFERPSFFHSHDQTMSTNQRRYANRGSGRARDICSQAARCVRTLTVISFSQIFLWNMLQLANVGEM